MADISQNPYAELQQLFYTLSFITFDDQNLYKIVNVQAYTVILYLTALIIFVFNA